MGGNSGVLCITPVRNFANRTNNTSNSEGCSNQISNAPPLCHLDMGVLESLPSELLSELNEIYGGKLVDLIAKSKGQGENSTSSLCFLPPKPSKGETFLPGVQVYDLISFYECLINVLACSLNCSRGSRKISQF